ncbi:MAG: biotin/lipoyl-binding protein, partial [Lysobacterales bacterium]
EIRKRIGDTVSRGELLARLDDAEYQQALREAEANLKIAEASLTEAMGQFELAKQELERAQQLQSKGIATRPGTHAVHMLGLYAESFSRKPADYPGARDSDADSMAIPLHISMTPEDFDYVVEAIRGLS